MTPPTLELGGRDSTLSEAKRARLAARLHAPLRKEEPASVPAPSTAPGSRGGPATLSAAQRRMWFFHELRPDSAVYNVPFVVRLDGSMNRAALYAAVGEMQRRHQILQSRIDASGETPVQVAEAGSPPAWREIDLTAQPGREEKLTALLLEECRRPFDLRTAPLWRVTLVKLGEYDHVLAVVIHHIASDLWSWSVFRRETQALYASFAAGLPPSLPPLPMQYEDFARAEAAGLASRRTQEAIEYWKHTLREAPATLDLPTDFPRPATMSFHGAVARRSLAPALQAELGELARQEDATLFMVLLAAFKVQLARLTGQGDVIVGVPTAGRADPQTNGLIGLFVNTLAIRNDLSADPTFSALLADVRTATLEALSHQDLPFDRVIDEVKPTRVPGHLPLVEVMFTLQGAAHDDFTLPGLRTTPIDVDLGTARFDLTLVAEQKADGLDLMLEYSTDLFTPATAERMLGQFQTLLESLAVDAHQPVSKLALLTPAERRQQLVEWNQTAVAFPPCAGLHRMFEAQAVAHPEREALVVGARRLTYQELNDRANRLATHLRVLGVERETRVGIFLTRDADMIVALLAVLKAGGAYVALDPAYPLERLSFILQDSAAAIVITQHSLQPSLPGCAAKVVVMEDLPRSQPLLRSPTPTAPRDLAYIIYTSGSTGRPKGVALEHRNAIAFVQWAQTVFSERDLTGVLAGTSICFDLSIFEIFTPLSSGGKIILAESPLSLPSLPAADEVRLVNTVPSVMREVLRLGLPASVETVNLAGEPLPSDLVDQLYARPSIRAVYDLYGPTETTTYSTFTRREPGARPTIGRPIANTELYILDRHLEPVPIGVAGELFIGGSGVTRGYLDRPALTAERFVPHPFSAQPEARLYRTGDLCRYRADGNVEYLGRGDQQVKVRGFRIELAEIEAALREHPGVAEAVVTAPECAPGERRLTAYIVPKETPAGAPEHRVDFRTFLRRSLPEPMVPSLFLTIPAIPRTTNGKINHTALPSSQAAPPDAASGQVPARDELESRLVAIWETVLGVKPIGTSDRFFDVGGHSLLAVRLAAVIEQSLDCRLPVATLLQAPSIAELAAILRTRGGTASPAMVAVQAKGRRPPLFLAHGMGGGNLWGYANIAREMGEDQPVYAFKPGDPETPSAFPTIEEMAARYIRELRQVQPTGPYHLGGYCFGGNIAYEMARQLEAAGEKVAVLALLNAWPANRGHDRITWSPRSAVKFAANLGYWATRLYQWPVQTRLRFLKWKVATIRRKLQRWNGRPAAGNGTEVELLVDLSETSPAERKLWQSHLEALRAYHPLPYGGTVTLLRTRGYPFFCSFDRAHGWRALAKDVVVRFVPGMHETIMVPPFVTALARELKAQLAGVSQDTDSSQNSPATTSRLPVRQAA